MMKNYGIKDLWGDKNLIVLLNNLFSINFNNLLIIFHKCIKKYKKIIIAQDEMQDPWL